MFWRPGMFLHRLGQLEEVKAVTGDDGGFKLAMREAVGA